MNCAMPSYVTQLHRVKPRFFQPTHYFQSSLSTVSQCRSEAKNFESGQIWKCARAYTLAHPVRKKSKLICLFYNIRTKKIEFLGTFSSYGDVRFFPENDVMTCILLPLTNF